MRIVAIELPFAVACVLLMPVSILLADITVSRTDVAGRLARQVTVPERSEAAKAETEQLKVRTQELLERITGEVLPSTLTADSVDALHASIDRPIVMKYADEEYQALLLKIHVLNVKVSLEYLRRFPPLSDETRAALRGQVSSLFDSIEKSMHRQLVAIDPPLANRKEIEDVTADAEQRLLAEIGSDALSHRLTRPIDDPALAALGRDFDRRLAESIDALKGELAAIPKNEERVQSRRFVLARVVGSAIQAFRRQTSAPERQAFDPDTVVPEYGKLAADLSAIEAKLRSRARNPGTRPTSRPAPR